jgi:hypothetical protein
MLPGAATKFLRGPLPQGRSRHVPTSPPELGWRRSPSPGGGNSFVHPVNAAAAPAGLQRVVLAVRNLRDSI